MAGSGDFHLLLDLLTILDSGWVKTHARRQSRSPVRRRGRRRRKGMHALPDAPSGPPGETPLQVGERPLRRRLGAPPPACHGIRFIELVARG
jgi:hypothetical protein